jgi:ribosomal protein S18 acetylase RimI-like enzyme
MGKRVMTGIISRLDQKKIRQHLRALCSIDKQVFGTDAWGPQNFEIPLPTKFELSRIAFHELDIAGYLVASEYSSKIAHIHRLVVASELRRIGIATELVKGFEEGCVAMKIGEVTLEVAKGNYQANCFYEKMGFRPMAHERLLNYLRAKSKIEFADRYLEESPRCKALVYSKSVR